MELTAIGKWYTLYTVGALISVSWFANNVPQCITSVVTKTIVSVLTKLWAVGPIVIGRTSQTKSHAKYRMSQQSRIGSYWCWDGRRCEARQVHNHSINVFVIFSTHRIISIYDFNDKLSNTLYTSNWCVCKQQLTSCFASKCRKKPPTCMCSHTVNTWQSCNCTSIHALLTLNKVHALLYRCIEWTYRPRYSSKDYWVRGWWLCVGWGELNYSISHLKCNRITVGRPSANSSMCACITNTHNIGKLSLSKA